MLLGAVPLVPFLGFLTLLIFGADLKKRTICIIGVSTIALSALLSLGCASQYQSVLSNAENYEIVFWTWIPFYGSTPDLTTIQFGFHLDNLSLLMICLVTFVATWIALFSVKFMEDEDDLARFFGSMNLFVSSMLVLVLADNLLLLLLGWEGVGLCSYLLIGFWYQNPATGRAATKAFITTRIGDVGLLLAIFLIAASLGSLHIQELTTLAFQNWPKDSIIATATALCILFAATGKSAQLPLQTWLPDAMLGPTPVSALIHAATMVTAGVYLIARLSGLFALSSTAMTCVLVVGAATLLIAGLSAIAQSDLKRVLAYSTVSQIGYMFLALGAGAYSAAMFHLVTHAFFKALLFLSAGVVGYSAHHEYNMFKLGGLRKTLPLAYYSFLVGALCLSALPLVTSGFYSKEFILGGVLHSVDGGTFAWICGIVGAFLTGLYTFRAISITFFGTPLTSIAHQPGTLMAISLAVLGVFALTLGFLQTPESLFNIHLFNDFIAQQFPPFTQNHGGISEMTSLVIASAVSLLGIGAGLYLFRTLKLHQSGFASSGPLKGIHALLANGMGFDVIYDMVVVAPYQIASQLLRRDVFGSFAQSVAQLVYRVANLLGRVQSGRLTNYASVIVFSIVVILGFVVFR